MTGYRKLIDEQKYPAFHQISCGPRFVSMLKIMCEEKHVLNGFGKVLNPDPLEPH